VGWVLPDPAPPLSERDEGEVGATAWRLPVESTDIEIHEIESSRRRRDPQRTPVPRQYLANRLDAGSLLMTSFPVGMGMQEGDNTQRVHTTITRR
jgi:hypothetical protein